MKFGIMFANTGHGASAAGAKAVATAAEAGGFESIWTVEHVVVPSGYESKYPYDPSGKMAGGAEEFDLPDPLIWLTWVAAHTSTIKLATGILIVPQRNPVVLAKELATLDSLSGGRMVLGIGAGWLAEEFAALGVSFDDRGKRLDEYIAVMRALWGGGKTTFSGDFFDFENCISRPTPTNGTIPVVVGGHTKVAARRAGRLGDGFFPGSAGMDEIAELTAIVRQTAEDNGRDPDAIEIIAGAGAPPGPKLDDRIEQLAAIGVTQAIVPTFPPDSLAEIGQTLNATYG
ncbi:MAG: LLM class F420-dependent oxidoreductase [Ilumatobacteraceae bacterium]